MNRNRYLGLVAIFLFSVLMPAFGQQTGEIRGVVTDDAKSPLPGVAITAKSSSLQGLRTAVTDEKGQFRLPLLPIGFYDLIFELPGFNRLTLAGNDVRLGFTASITVVLKETKLAEEVTVSAPNPLIDKTRADNSFRLRGEDLARVPSQSRTIEEIISYTPGVTGVRASTINGTGTGLPSFRGEGEEGNNWLVDGLSMKGVNNSDPAVRVNYDAWEEVEIVSDGFTPALGQALGGFINVVTKSGGNEFHGEAGTLIRARNLRANRQPQLSVVSLPDTSLYDFFGNVGGPVIKDKFWFFISDNFHRTLDDTQNQSIGWLTIPAGHQRINTNNVFGKLTFTPLKNHTLSLAGTWDKFLGQTGGIGVPETYNRTTYSNTYFRLNYRGILSSNTYLTAAFGNYQRQSVQEPLGNDSGPPPFFWQDIAQWTNNFFGCLAHTEKRLDFSTDATFYFDLGSGGSHELHAGLSFYDNQYHMSSLYAGLDFDLWPGNGFDNGTTVGWASPGIPMSLTEHGPGDSRNVTKGFGFYLSDNFTIRRFSIMLGVRMETQNIYDDMGTNLWSWNLGDFFSPRIAIAWDLFGDGVNVLKLGYGLFVNPMTTGVLSFFNKNFAYGYRYYQWSGSADPTDQALMNSANWEFYWEQSPTTVAAKLDAGLRPDRTTKLMVEFDRQIGRSWALRLRGINSSSKNLMEDVWIYDPSVEGSLQNTFANFELKRRDYRAIEVELDGRIDDHFALFSSYTWSQAKGTNPGQAGDGGFYDGSPFGDHPDLPEGAPEKELYDYLFAGLGGRGISDEGWYGFLPYSVDHLVKFLLTYRAPFDIDLSLGGEFLSGYHWQKRGFVPAYGYYSFPEGRGVRTTPAHAYLDLAADKEIPLQGGRSLRFGFNIYNLLNSQKPISFIQEDTELFGQVWGRQLPRWLQFKISLLF